MVIRLEKVGYRKGNSRMPDECWFQAGLRASSARERQSVAAGSLRLALLVSYLTILLYPVELVVVGVVVVVVVVVVVTSGKVCCNECSVVAQCLFVEW